MQRAGVRTPWLHASLPTTVLVVLVMVSGCAPRRAPSGWSFGPGSEVSSQPPSGPRTTPSTHSIETEEAAARHPGSEEEGVRPASDGRHVPLVPAVEPRPDRLPRAATKQEVSQLEFQTKRIYGSDDRRDIWPGMTKDLEPRAPDSRARVGTPEEWAKQVVETSRAVALMVLATELTPRPDGSIELASITYAAHVRKAHSDAPLCNGPASRFRAQPTAGICTAWLAAPTLVVTARHCVAGRAAEDLAFVFDWRQRADNIFPGTPARLDGTQVYRGRAFRARGTGAEDGDFAVIELDRPVPVAEHIAPLVLRRSGRPQIGERLYLLGCPRGLPVKFADGAQVKAVHREMPLLRADLDAFHGNSGSPVLSSLDHRVVGILVRGESDFLVTGDPPCVVEVRTNFTRGGETVLGSMAFARHIPLTETEAR